jgi:uncharacterized repeat protein (TIGR01451 family)
VLRRFTFAAVLIACVMAVMATSASAQVGGPVILGGDDLTSHGSVDATGASQDGWLYMERAVGNIKAKVGRANDGSIAAFGSADTGPVLPFDGGDAGKGIRNAADKNGMTVRYFDSVAEINTGFADINSGAYQPAIIWIAGDDASNDIEQCEDQDPANQTDGEAITANANVINNFVNSGGGLFSHGVCYTWLSALLPGLTTDEGGGSDDLYRTPEGLRDFPDVSDDDFNAGPWHNHFEGNFGGLDVLVRSNQVDDSSGNDAAVVLGGGQVSLTERPADLSIAKADAPDPVTEGSDLTYTLTVTNNGPGAATGVTVTDDLPGDLAARSSSASKGSCSGTTTVTCTLGDLASGASATVTIVIRPGSPGSITNTARVSGSQPDPNLANNSATQTTQVSARPAVRARDSRAPVIAVAGVNRRSCVRAAFTATFRIRDRSRLRRLVITLDGRRIARTTRKRFTVRIGAASMRSGRHTLRVIAVDRAGNRRVARRSFLRCARQPAPVPVFTG